MGDTTCAVCGNRISGRSPYNHCLRCGTPRDRSTAAVALSPTADVDSPTAERATAADAFRQAARFALKTKQALDRRNADVAVRKERERTLKLLQRKVRLKYLGGHPELSKQST